MGDLTLVLCQPLKFQKTTSPNL